MEEKEILDKYLREIIMNDEKCRNCTFKHENNVCFFAYECIKNNHNDFLKEENKLTDILVDPYDMKYIRCGKGENNE